MRPALPRNSIIGAPTPHWAPRKEIEVTKLNKRSQLITAGVARSPNRAMLRAVGFQNGDFEKPIIGVANGHSTMNPCNAGIQPLVDRVMAALKEAGAMPQEFGFPTVTDGNGQRMDGVVAVGGCDKNLPGSVMAMARMNVPGIFVYAGTIKPGFWKGEKLTIVSPFEALGMSLLGSSQMASPDKEKAQSAAESARVLVEAVRKDLKPRDIITRKSIENAVALVMATGGSTNAVLHYLAIASAAG